MANVLNQIKILLELDDALEADSGTVYDSQILLYINQGIAVLARNKVPVTTVTAESDTEDWATDSTDNDTIIGYLHLFAMQRFDRTLLTVSSRTTLSWINEEMEKQLYSLKTIYDFRSDSP